MRSSIQHASLTVAAVALGALALTESLPAIEPLQEPTKFRFLDKAKAYNSHAFFGDSGTAYLIDMQGKVVHTWPAGGNPKPLNKLHPSSHPSVNPHWLPTLPLDEITHSAALRTSRRITMTDGCGTLS